MEAVCCYYLPNLIPIDPGTVAAPVLDKNAFVSFYYLALDLGDCCEPFLVPHVRLPYDVVTGASSTKPEHVRLERNSGERAAVRVELTPDTGHHSPDPGTRSRSIEESIGWVEADVTPLHPDSYRLFQIRVNCSWMSGP